MRGRGAPPATPVGRATGDVSVESDSDPLVLSLLKMSLNGVGHWERWLLLNRRSLDATASLKKRDAGSGDSCIIDPTMRIASCSDSSMDALATTRLLAASSGSESLL